MKFMPHQITYPRDYEPEKKILCKIIYNFDSTQFEPVITRPTGPSPPSTSSSGKSIYVKNVCMTLGNLANFFLRFCFPFLVLLRACVCARRYESFIDMKNIF